MGDALDILAGGDRIKRESLELHFADVQQAAKKKRLEYLHAKRSVLPNCGFGLGPDFRGAGCR